MPPWNEGALLWGIQRKSEGFAEYVFYETGKEWNPMLTLNDLGILHEFCRQAHELRHDGKILDAMALTEEAFGKTIRRLYEAAKVPQASLPPELVLAQKVIDYERGKEKDAADKRARIAKLNYDAAREAGMPNPEAFAIGVEAVRQECGK